MTMKRKKTKRRFWYIQWRGVTVVGTVIFTILMSKSILRNSKALLIRKASSTSWTKSSEFSMIRILQRFKKWNSWPSNLKACLYLVGNLKRQLVKESSMWEKMKEELKKKFLPKTYKQDAFFNHNFKQEALPVEEYTAEFHCRIWTSHASMWYGWSRGANYRLLPWQSSIKNFQCCPIYTLLMNL